MSNKKKWIAIKQALDDLEKCKETLCEISEILVDVSKSHYTDSDGIDEIRESILKLDHGVLTRKREMLS